MRVCLPEQKASLNILVSVKYERLPKVDSDLPHVIYTLETTLSNSCSVIGQLQEIACYCSTAGFVVKKLHRTPPMLIEHEFP